jgi:NADP-dependent 3-hydroxy acid dehydrogenase YdfG
VTGGASGIGLAIVRRLAVEKALEVAHAEFGPVEIMVTSAGLSLNAPSGPP